MRSALGVFLAILVMGALIIFQSRLIVSNRELEKLFVDSNKSNIVAVAKGIYNQEVIADKGSLEIPISNSLLVYDNSKKTLKFSDGSEMNDKKRYELLTSVIVRDSVMSIFEKEIDKPHIEVFQRNKDLRYYESLDFNTPFIKQNLEIR